MLEPTEYGKANKNQQIYIINRQLSQYQLNTIKLAFLFFNESQNGTAFEIIANEKNRKKTVVTINRIDYIFNKIIKSSLGFKYKNNIIFF